MNELSLANGDSGMTFQQYLASLDGGMGNVPMQSPNGYQPSTTTKPGWGDKLNSGLNTASLAMQGITGIMGAMNAYDQNKLLKQQFKMSLADRNQNIANQAATTNLALNNQATMAAQMMGNSYGSQGYDEYVKNNRVQVDGSPIKL